MWCHLPYRRIRTRRRHCVQIGPFHGGGQQFALPAQRNNVLVDPHPRILTDPTPHPAPLPRARPRPRPAPKIAVIMNRGSWSPQLDHPQLMITRILGGVAGLGAAVTPAANGVVGEPGGLVGWGHESCRGRGYEVDGRRIVAELVRAGRRGARGAPGRDGAGGAGQAATHPCRPGRVRAAADRVRAFAPDAVIDTIANSRATWRACSPTCPTPGWCMLSSVDVYQAFGLVRGGLEGEPLPLHAGCAGACGAYIVRNR